MRFDAGLPTLWVAHCHCSLCRRAHGSAFITWAGFEQSSVRIEDGESQLRWYASSPGAERGFCARCGSSMLFRSSRWPGELHITLANFHDALDRAPQVHVFYDAHVPWFEVNDALPKKGAPGP